MKNKIKVIILDYDLTIVVDGQLKSDTINLIKLLHDKYKYKLAIASFNEKAREYLKKFDILKYFTFIQGYSDVDKIPHMKNILKFYNINKSQAIFFDDDMTNYCEINNFGIETIRVNPKYGLTIDNVKHANLI